MNQENEGSIRLLMMSYAIDKLSYFTKCTSNNCIYVKKCKKLFTKNYPRVNFNIEKTHNKKCFKINKECKI